MGKVGVRRSAVRAFAVVAATVMTTSCVAAVINVAPPPPVPESDSPNCNRQAIRSCLLPFPSDQYQVSDETSPTGVRLNVPADVMPAGVLAQFGPGASIEDAFGGADGFSAVTPIIFETAEKVWPQSLPADGGDALVVTDATTGERVPIRAELAHDTERFVGHERTVVIAWPVTKFAYGHTIVAVLTDALIADGGRSVSAAPSMAQARSRLDKAVGPGPMSAAMADMPAAKSSWDHAVSATSFVVRSQAGITDWFDTAARIVRSEDHPIRNIAVGPSLFGGAASVTGQIRISDVRTEDRVLPKGLPTTAIDRWIDFLMILPERPLTPAGAPVVIYGHGISVFKESMLVVAARNASHGLATVGIDIPNHGSRSDEGWLLSLANPGLFGRLAAMPAEGELDQLSLLLAIKSHFSSIDVAPYNLFTGSHPDGVADIDPTHVLYEGTSMGGFLGAAFTAIAPELDGSFLQVPGSGIAETIYRSIIWWLFTPVMPQGVSAGDAQALLGAAGMLLDRSENVYLLDRIRASGKPFFLAMAEGDGTVPNGSTERLIRETGVPTVGPFSDPPPGVAHVEEMPADGRGAIEIDTSGYDFFRELSTHTAFTDPYPSAILDQWLAQRVAEWG